MTGATQNPDERVLRYLQFCSHRVRGLSEDQIANKLGFGSPELLYQRLNQDGGFPVCLLCGATPAPPGHCQDQTGKSTRGKKSGEAVKLPPASDARDLFGEALKTLSGYLDPDAYLESRLESLPEGSGLHDFMEIVGRQDLLGELEEHLQGRRFVAAGVSRPDADDVGIFRHEDFSAEEWEEVCEHYGEDPSQEAFATEHVSVSPIGAR
jgi:hypothetical protein